MKKEFKDTEVKVITFDTDIITDVVFTSETVNEGEDDEINQ